MKSSPSWTGIILDGGLVVVGLGGMWFGPSTPLGVSVLVGFGAAIVLMTKRRHIPVVLLLLASPFSILLGAGAVQYAMGRAKLMSVGKPEVETFNLDTWSRCPRSTTGCFTTGGEWVFQLPYNTGVMLLTALFGPMPGTYRGPYPSRDEAVALLETQGVPIAVDSLVGDAVVLPDREIRLDHRIGASLLSIPHSGLSSEEVVTGGLLPKGKVTAMVLGNKALLLRVPFRCLRACFGKTFPEDDARIALIDIANGRPFAFFAEGSGDGGDLPPATYFP